MIYIYSIDILRLAESCWLPCLDPPGGARSNGWDAHGWGGCGGLGARGKLR